MSNQTNLRVRPFDVVTSALMALMLWVGTLVTLLLLIWLLGNGDENKSIDAVPVSLATAGQRGDLELDFDQPPTGEVETLIELAVSDSMEAMADAAGRVVGAARAAGILSGTSGSGDSHGGDPDGGLEIGPGPSEGTPRFERWQLEFAARDLRSYARQLDHFGIELGAIGGGIVGVDYVHDFSEGPLSRRGASEAEQRMYFLWNEPGPLLGYDRQLLLVAGVELEGRVVIKFVSHTLENRLARLELEYARAHGRSSVAQIAKTVFRSETTADGYSFRVVGQRYHSRSG